MQAKNRIGGVLLRLSLCLILLILVLLCSLLYKNRRIAVQHRHNDCISIYYRDTLDIDSIFPEYAGASFSVDNKTVLIKERNIFFPNPESIGVEDLSFNVDFENALEKNIKVRCWKEDLESIQEVSVNKLWNGSILKLLCNKVFRANLKGRKTVVACGDSLYDFRSDGVIHFSCRGYQEEIPTDIAMLTSEYNQIVSGDDFVFLRNGPKLLVSKDNFRTYKTVYDDRRGIKESMVWSSKSKKLLFTMYTPGSVRLRHYLLSYDPYSERLDTLQTFFSSNDHTDEGLSPYCRHIHFITQDPFTGNIFIGVGDYEDEPAIYMSADGGLTIQCIGKGSQMWRSLSMFFTNDFIFWTTDSESPQYIYRINRSQLDGEFPIQDSTAARFPLFNSALWCNVKIDDANYFMGSNSEGCYYDDFHRIYRIHFGNDGIPIVYAVLEEASLPEKGHGIKYHQTSPLCLDYEDNLWCYDTHLGLRKFKVKSY